MKGSGSFVFLNDTACLVAEELRHKLIGPSSAQRAGKWDHGCVRNLQSTTTPRKKSRD